MPKLDPENARQGRRGAPILIILIAALSLAAIAFIGLGIYGWILPDAPPPPTAGASPAANASNAPADAAPVTVSPDAGIQQAPAAPEKTN
ncbi:hypothetical protein [Consotaella salsifontis]|uniref:Uncharacterized protein n=1 Tax=Consotaella salsifontis TaxID=1365950 RepID=A0A1T4NTV2_9HYPH|nr:hypothetical protein [Consotaella salsifontis]SJZ82671.1 hypothetical protein SAMN05428963_103186 [Consotaella salsifontis]